MGCDGMMKLDSMRSIQASSLTSTKDLEIASRKTAHLLYQTGAGCRQGRLRARIATSPWANHARLRASSALPNLARCVAISTQLLSTKASSFKNGIGSSRTAVNTKAVCLTNMPYRKKRSKDHYPTQWSEWEWNEQYQRHCRYRENGEGMLLSCRRTEPISDSCE
jgi:hypothetical protein